MDTPVKYSSNISSVNNVRKMLLVIQYRALRNMFSASSLVEMRFVEKI